MLLLAASPIISEYLQQVETAAMIEAAVAVRRGTWASSTGNQVAVQEMRAELHQGFDSAANAMQVRRSI